MLGYFSANKDWIFSGIGIVLLFTLIPVTIKYAWSKVRRRKTDPERLSLNKKRNQRRRQALLDLVQHVWVEGFLDKSLNTEVLINLDLEERLDAIERPFDAMVRIPGREDQLLPHGTRLIEVFDQVQGALLILGEPGAGKTTMLLELTRDLINRAKTDKNHPIPVVFNLSSWAQSGQTIAEWVIDELKTQYSVSRKVGQFWFESDSLILLLDGLDEVALERREDCVKAINDFRQAHMVSLAICSRVRDYEMLTNRLRLHGAVSLRSLTPKQINDYLNGLSRLDSQILRQLEALLDDTFTDEALRCFCYDNPDFKPVYDLFAQETDKTNAIRLLVENAQERGLLDALIKLINEHSTTDNDIPISLEIDDLSSIRTMLERDVEFQKLAQSPLILSIMVLAYKGKSIEDLQSHETIESHRKQVFNAYVEMVFQRRVTDMKYTKKQTIHWLGWLARNMLHHNLAIFSSEVIQPSWLPQKSVQAFSRSVGLTIMLGFLMSCAVCYGLIGLSSGPGGAVLYLIVGLVLGGFAWLSWVLVDRHLQPGLMLTWSWASAKGGITRGLREGAQIGLIPGLISGLIEGVASGPVDGLILGLGLGLGVGLLFGLLGAIREMIYCGLVGAPIDDQFNVRPVMLLNDTLDALLLAFSVSKIKGYFVRSISYRSGCIPKDYVRFLDYCTERILLRKVGGGYIFIHRLLMEYFADLEPTQTE